MDKQEITAALERIFQREFPTVLVKARDHADDGGDPIFDVYCIPDDKRGEFLRYRLDVYTVEADRIQLPGVYLITHTIDETRERYPTVWDEYMKRQTPAEPVSVH